MNVVDIVITAKNLTGPALADVNAKVASTSGALGKLTKTGVLATAALVGIGVAGVKAASKFNSEMQLLSTQAGVSQSKIKGLSQGVLELAGQVGQNPDSLAESLYHVESNFESMGISSTKALNLVKVAAQGASTGHADLVDVTNALTAAVASGIPGVKSYSQAMGVLNATVGVGDMKMQDLAAAFGGGMVATVKGYGLSIQDVGAALATFGDNNIRGAAAGTQLRMSVQALAKPVATGGDALAKLGLQTDTLAKDMQKGGLKAALEDLVSHMTKAGITSKEQGAIITDAFGRKAGAGLNILVGQMDRLESKYPALAAGASNFDKAWAQTQKSFAQQEKELQASFDALLIEIGDRLMPVVQGFVSLLLEHKTATVAVVGALAGLVAATAAVSIGMKTAAAATALFKASSAGVAAVTGVFETVALKAMYLHDAFAAAGGGAAGLKAAFADLSTGAKLGVTITAVAALVLVLKEVADSGQKAPANVDKLTTSLGNLGRTGRVSGEALRVFGTNLSGLAYDVNRVAGQSQGMDHFNDIMNRVLSLGMAKSNSFKQASSNISAIDQSLAALVQGGHADLAAAALKQLDDAYTKSGGKPSTLAHELSDYNNALQSNALQTKVTADSMGLFGQQAVTTQAALTAQQNAADGLRQSLQALNNVNRAGLGGMIAFNQSIADTAAAAKKDAGALTERNGQLVLTTQQSRDAASALSDLADKTDSAAASAKDSGKSWAYIDGIYSEGRSKLLAAAEAMGLTKSQAEALANTILKTPNKTVKLSGDLSDLQSKLNSAKKELASVPSSKKAALEADISRLESQIAAAKRAIAGVQGKTVSVTVAYRSTGTPGRYMTGGFAHGGIVGGAATGGARGGTTLVGEQGPELVRLPYGSTVIPAGTTRSMLKGELSARNAAVGDLSISHFGTLAGYKTDEFTKALAKPADLSDLNDALNKWRGVIENATHGVAQSRLLKDLDKGGAALLTNEKRLTSVNSALATAKDKLSSLNDAASQLKSSISSTVLSSGDPTATIDQGGGLAGVMGRLQGSVDSATAFSGALSALKKKGLNSTLLQEIAQAGPGAGLQTAEALMGASSGDIKTLNGLQSKLSSAATSAGSTTADAVYGAQIKAAQSTVTALTKTQTAIEKAMATITAGLEAAIKKGLGVGHHATGGIIGAATGGARGGLTWVGEQGAELVRLPYGSTVYPAGQSRAMAARGGAGQPVVIEFVSSGGTADKLLLQWLRKSIRVRGGNVQLALGVH